MAEAAAGPEVIREKKEEGEAAAAGGDRCSESSRSGSQGKRGQEIVLHSAGGSSASSHDAESNAVRRNSS